jgi:predicted negative regulator of RcsB-dependent stress response
MARPVRRITRKDIRRPDQFITLTGQFLELFAQHRTKFLASLALIVALLFGAWGWDLYRTRQNRLAEREFNTALILYHNNKYREALEALAKLDIYRSSSYSTLGLLYQAHSYIALKDNSNAEAKLQELLRREKKDPLLGQLALLTLGYTQERSGRFKEAVQSFSQAEALQGPFKEEALLAKARSNSLMNNYKEALNAYRQFALSYPNSERTKEAMLLAQDMESKAGGPSAGK